MKPVKESIVIEEKLPAVFSFVTDIQQIENMSLHIENVRDIVVDKSLVGTTYSQTRVIHKRKYEQTVVVSEYVENEKYVLSTMLFGVALTYTYLFTANKIQDTTILTVIKQGSPKGFFKILSPLLKHIFTRPEHEGSALESIKQFIEKNKISV